MSPDERRAFVDQGILSPVDVATRDRWLSTVATLPALRDRVRELSRQALATPGPTAPPELQQMIRELEEIAGQKTSVDSLVWNGPTQEYVKPTLLGRSVLEDLSTWQKHLEGRSFEQFQQDLSTYRGGLFETIQRADLTYRGLVLTEPCRRTGSLPRRRWRTWTRAGGPWCSLESTRFIAGDRPSTRSCSPRWHAPRTPWMRHWRVSMPRWPGWRPGATRTAWSWRRRPRFWPRLRSRRGRWSTDLPSWRPTSRASSTLPMPPRPCLPQARSSPSRRSTCSGTASARSPGETSSSSHWKSRTSPS